MTGKRIKDRLKDGEGAEFTYGIPTDGTVDPTGEYPRRDNWFGSSVSSAARGVKVNNIWMGGSAWGVSFDVHGASPSMYPFSQANETPSGHSFEIDDTPGGERILIKHNTGAGLELKADGSVVVASKFNRIEVVGADHSVVVQGKGDVVYDGDLNLTVNGDYNVKVNGTYNLEVGANHNHSVHGTYSTETGDVHSTIVGGNKDVRVNGDAIDFHVGERKIVTKNDIRVITGKDFIVNSKRHLRFTAEEFITASSGKVMTLASKSMNITGKTGKIGSTEFVYVGKQYTGKKVSGKSTATFEGYLVGRALESWTSKFSKFSEQAHTSHYSTYAHSARNAIGAISANWAELSGTAGLAITSASTTPGPPTPDPQLTTMLPGGFYATPANSLSLWPAAPMSGIFQPGPAVELDSDTFPVMVANDGINWVNKYIFDEASSEDDPSGYGWNPVNPDQGGAWIGDKASTDPDWVDVWLKISPFAVRKVIVDQDNQIAHQIENWRYGNYFKWTPDIQEIRSKMRTMDGANDQTTGGQTSGSQCIDALLDENIISPKYKNPVAPEQPYEQKRVGKNTPDAKYGYSLLGNPVERRSKTFVPKTKNSDQRTIVADPLYNPDKHDAPISSSTKLSRSATISKFLGAPGSKSSLDYVPLLADRQVLARQWYLHAMLMDGIASSKEFSDYRLQVTEGYYHPANGIRRNYKPTENESKRYWREPYRSEDGGSTQKSVITGKPTINELKHSGRAVVYTLYNSRGNVDFSATFDLSIYIRDTFYFDQLSLDYDTLRSDRILSQQLIVVMPEIYGDFKASFQQRTSTYFNRKTLSSSYLIEISD